MTSNPHTKGEDGLFIQPCANGAAFTLETSGEVENPAWLTPVPSSGQRLLRWTDLDPFAQGYGTEMARELHERLPGLARGWTAREGVAFGNWAPETVAAILRDCEAFAAAARAKGPWESTCEGGAAFWAFRNIPNLAGFDHHAFPPVTPYLGHDGKVYLRASR